MTAQIVAALLATGAVTGFLAGLMGIGGGMMMVPIISALLWSMEFPAEQVVRVAIATSLTTILFTSVSSVRAHHRRGAVLWPTVWRLAPGILLGALGGAQLAGRIDSRLLAGTFALFVGLMAGRMLLERPAAPAPAPARAPGDGGSRDDGSAPPRPANAAALFVPGVVIGVISALVGAGGGFLTVPFLAARGVDMKNAVATSAACGFPIALAGALGYVIAGWNAALPGPMLGYIYLPALALIAVTSVITARFGARAAHAMPTALLRKAFAVILIAVAGYMLWKALQQGG